MRNGRISGFCEAERNKIPLHPLVIILIIAYSIPKNSSKQLILKMRPCSFPLTNSLARSNSTYKKEARIGGGLEPIYKIRASYRARVKLTYNSRRASISGSSWPDLNVSPGPAKTTI